MSFSGPRPWLAKIKASGAIAIGVDHSPDERLKPSHIRSMAIGRQNSDNDHHDGFAKHYDYALETIRAIPYDLWHEYDPEGTMRFYALRMYDAGMLRNNLNTLLAEGTDWRFLNELKREMKI